MDGIAWAASAMAAAQRRLEIAAQNLANGSTDGFRRQVARGRLSARGVSIGTGVDRAQGAFRATGRPFDLAITGAGAFHLRTASGKIVETRDGSFARDRFGYLRDAHGAVLLGDCGAVRVRAGMPLPALGLPARSSVRQGFLETSNVDAIGEVVDIISAQRSFEVAQKVLSAIDRTRERNGTQVGTLK